MNTGRNPFSAGSWVTGADFFCRRHLIQNLLNSNESCDWVIGKRRIGKTSLLRQIEFEVNGQDGDRFALFWDIQGSFNAEGLTESLIDAIEDSRDEYPDHWQATSELAEGQPSSQILKKVARGFHRHGKKMTLLIDEAEEFMTIGKDDVVLLGKLRKIFQNTSHLHTIISSTPRLEQLHKEVTQNTSPFLHGFHASYLGNFLPDSARALLKRGIEKAEIIEQIIRKTDGNPFEMQLFAKHYFENPDLEEVSLHLEANPSLTQVIEVNYDLLTNQEQNLLNEVSVGKTAMAKYGSSKEKVLISKLVQMGYLEKESDKNRLRIGSFFQQRWLAGKQETSPIFHPQQQTDSYLETNHQGLILKQVVSLYKFFLEFAQDHQKLATYENSFKVSAINGHIYPIRKKLLGLLKEERKDPTWVIGILETVSCLKHFLKEPENWTVFRLIEMAEKGPAGYSESEFLDLMLLIAEESQLEDQLF